MNRPLFVLGDADQVRRRVDSLLLANRLKDLQALSSTLTNAIQRLGVEAQNRMKAEIVFCGGDDILFLVEPIKFSDNLIRSLMDEFLSVTGLTISFGIGRSVEEAYLNLARAKASGAASLVSVGAG